jgi:hypothetical protein
LIYVVTIVVVVVAGMGGLGLWIVHEENRPGERPIPTIMRRGRRVVRKVMAGDPCACGGVITDTGVASPRLGEIMGCDGCGRRWSVDGRRVGLRRGPLSARGAGRSPDLTAADEAAGTAEP